MNERRELGSRQGLSSDHLWVTALSASALIHNHLWSRRDRRRQASRTPGLMLIKRGIEEALVAHPVSEPIRPVLNR